MSLSIFKIDSAKPKAKPYKLFDSNGLYLHVLKSGRKIWRYKYKMNNKEFLLTIGVYTTTKGGVSLANARKERDKAQGLVINGINPAKAKQDLKKETVGKTFSEAALAWAEYKAMPETKRCWKPSHKLAVIKSLEKEVYHYIGDKVLTTIEKQDIDAVIDPILERGALEVADRALQRIDAVFRYGIYKDWCKHNPASGKSEYMPKRKVKHMKHLTLDNLPAFLRDLDNYKGDFICMSAVKFVLFTYVRTKEVRFSTWDEIDLEKGLWEIPEDRMKMKISQTVPLCRQAISLLESVKPITGNSKYIFASLINMSQPISENGMLSVIYRMGYKGKTTIHGLRGTFSTIANETLRFRRDVIEASLAHKVDDPVRGAYCHATYLEERTENAQVWADFLDGLKQGADVIPIRKQG